MSISWTELRIRMAFGSAQRMVFYKKFALLLDNGVPLEAALKELRRVSATDNPVAAAKAAADSAAAGEAAGKLPWLDRLRAQMKPRNSTPPLVILLDRMLRAVRSGRGFAEAIEPYCTPQEASIVSAGEASGSLREAFRRVALVMQQQRETRKRFIVQLGGPALAIVAMIVVYCVVGMYLGPMLTKLMPAEKWMGDTGRLLTLSLWVSSNIVFIVIGLAALLGGLIYGLPRITGPIRDRLDKFPIFSMYRLFIGSTFLLNVATKQAQGIAIEDALKRERMFASPYLRERVDHTLRGIRSGLSFGDALQAAEHDFPDRETIGMLRVISSRKGFAEALEKFTVEWLDSNLDAMTKANQWIRVIALLVVGLGVTILAKGVIGIQDNIQAALSAHV